MASTAQYYGINADILGHLYDWGSLSLNLFGNNFVYFDSVNLKEERDSVNVYAGGQLPVGWYNKNVVYDLSIGILYDKFQDIVKASLALGLKPYQVPAFPVILTLGSFQDPSVPYRKIIINNVRITSNNFDSKQNTGGHFLMYKMPVGGPIIDSF